ncbi:hypothetical protein ACQ7CU_03970 [Chryseobacterium arthrosphaerae]|uniref:hypothetical protein n=1 Tax=Chryseobacterium arthrosphaerae TaxID=651561 RepID=UPI003D3332DA
MEENKQDKREELKTYFETGKYPTENQFSDLIDSLKLKGDLLTNKDAVIIANSLNWVYINNAYVSYYTSNLNGARFQFTISSADEEDQLLTIEDFSYNDKKQYFFGKAPYTIKAKELPAEGLGETEYYHVFFSLEDGSTFARLIGNSLPEIPEGFVLGILNGKRLMLQINRQNMGQRLNIVNTGIKFLNKTSIPVQYSIQASYWGHAFTFEDIVTDHYDAWDSLNFYFKADLRGVEQSVECSIYDTDQNRLLTTVNLEAGQNYMLMGGNEVKGIRNIRIECNYTH